MGTQVIEYYKQIVQMLGGQFGDSCQSILYGLENNKGQYTGKVLAMSGTTTDAQLDDPLPPFLVGYIEQNGLRNQYGFINKAYPGLVLRTSIQFVKMADNEKVVCCLCIHHNIVHIKMITSFLEELTRPSVLEDENETDNEKVLNGGKLYTASNIQGFLDSIISEFLAERIGGNNFAALEKNDKLALISELDKKGVFLIKGAVNLIAKRMNVSKFSIYNYLDEIRADK